MFRAPNEKYREEYDRIFNRSELSKTIEELSVRKCDSCGETKKTIIITDRADFHDGFYCYECTKEILTK